jgi:multiple sugar transport system substrate-binding protein
MNSVSTDRAGKFRIAVRRFQPFADAIQQQWAAFEAGARTGLTLDLIQLDLNTLENTLFRSNEMQSGIWDVAFVNTDWIASLHPAGVAVDLAPLLHREPEYPETWTPSLLKLQQIGDSVLGVPYHDGPECLIYRCDLFDDPGIRAEYFNRFQRSLEVPKTWSEFLQVARFFNDPAKGLSGTVFAAFPDGHNTVYDFLLQLWTRGGELITEDGSVTFETYEAIEALSFYRDIVRDTSAVPANCTDLDSVAAGQLFAQGKVAMMVNWFGFAAHAHTAEGSAVRGQVDVAPIPAGSIVASTSLNVYWLLAAASGSIHREIACRFLLHMQSAEMDRITSMCGAIGCRRSTWRDHELNAAIPFYHRLEDLHAGARQIPQHASWPKIARIIDELMVGAIATELPIHELLSKADQSWTASTGAE